MTVLAITCHPDDAEVSCAGTLLKCVQRGDRVVVCHVANGDMGHVLIEPEELRKIRGEEARRAGRLGGIEVMTLDVGDLRPNGADLDQRDAVAQVICRVKPDLILTHAPEDYMPDHVAVSQLVFGASFAASVPHYVHTEPAAVTPIYYLDTLAGVAFQPTEYVDISEVMEQKLAMLECHESQLKWMREHDGIDFSDFVRTCAKFRGLQCGVAYAEAFRPCLAWPKILPKRLLP